MVDVYVRLINNGLRTIDQVPILWREEVRTKLEEQNK